MKENDSDNWHQIMSEQTNEELITILIRERFKYRKTTLEYAKLEVQKRELNLDEIKKEFEFSEEGDFLFDKALEYALELEYTHGFEQERIREELEFKGVQKDTITLIFEKIQNEKKQTRKKSSRILTIRGVLFIYIAILNMNFYISDFDLYADLLLLFIGVRMLYKAFFLNI